MSNLNINSLFSESYQQSRERFLTTMKDKGAEILSLLHPDEGPNMTPLYMDVASLKRAGNKQGIVLVSGTHGPEGFCGAACQNYMVERGGLAKLLETVNVFFIHGHNPFGFAWNRRFTENNVDLNRNYADFEESQSFLNVDYLEISDLIHPHDLTEECFDQIKLWISERGASAFHQVALSGQRVDPDGILYGGVHGEWSNTMIRSVLPGLLGNLDDVVVIDIHSGLGDYGVGEIFSVYQNHDPRQAVLAQWYDDLIARNDSSNDANASGASEQYVTDGDFCSALTEILPQTTVYAFALEYGTVEFDRVFQALVRENFAYHKYGLDDDRTLKAGQRLRDCFYINSPEWKELVITRFEDILVKTLRGLQKLSGD
ncbi:DUF2817 domain-containing protein [Temperatibacter marinus]|uniref:DUF2817 domain-containing protein n=1 Tax=Temperatibacter marinus TaxID=1456591 RepID=A0AA52EGX3_9PROT|nr:DUF2817 domain-containing protein [Temperatibacter marinus]WND01856.1 DUF2817 domain-containing protein [Temperatibacter marinus]